MPVASRQKEITDAIMVMLKAAIGTSSGATHLVADANFKQAKVPNGDAMTLPGCVLSPGPEIEGKGTNRSNDIGYAVQVTIAQASDRDEEADADRIYYWRKTAAGALREKRLTGVAAVHLMAIEPRPIIDLAAFSAQHDATAFVVRAWVRESPP